MTASQEQKTSSTRQLLSPAHFWSLLRAPETLVLAFLALVLVLSLAFIIPQQPAAITSSNSPAFTLWVAGLPRFYQESVELFDVLGLFRIGDTIWFWFPMAALVLVCLIALADYMPLAWPRFWRKWPALARPQGHPFHRHQQQTFRAPSPTNAAESAATAAPLAHLAANLAREGYHLQPGDEAQDLLAVHFPRRWAGPGLVLFGLLVIALGLVVQALWGDGQTSAVVIGSAARSAVAGQVVRIKAFRPGLDEFKRITGGELMVELGGASPSTWRLHRPYRVQGWWVIPAGIQPTAQMTLQQNQNGQETATMTFSDPLTPLEFSSPEQDLLFALHYLPGPEGPAYQLTLIAMSANASEPPQIQRDGPNFAVPDFNLTGQIVVEEELTLRAFRLPGMEIIAGGFLVLATGLAILSLAPPSLVWVQMITIGRGCRVEAAAEILRTMPPDDDKLERAVVFPSLEGADD